jgi:excisionase family DNA binding protein
MRELMTVAEAAIYLNVSPHTLYSWSSRKVGPPRYLLGKAVRYDRGAVDRWLDEHEQMATG